MASHTAAQQRGQWHAVYDQQSQVLTLTFPNGRSYDFSNVPPDLYDRFQRAESKGEFYNTYLRGQY